MLMGRPRERNKDLPPFMHRKPGGGFYFRGPRNGKDCYHGFKARERDAAIDEYWKYRRTTDAGEAGTLGEIVDAYLEHPLGLKSVKSKSTRDEYERMVPIVRDKWGKERYALTEDRGILDPDVLKASVFDDFLCERRGQRGEVADNRLVRFVSTLFRFARRRSMTTFNPVAGAVFTPEVPRKTEADRDALELTRKAANPPMALMIELASVTSLDQSVIRLLTLPQVGELIDAGRIKSGVEQDWEITPYVRSIFERAKLLPGRGKSIFVFPRSDGTAFTLGQFQAAFRHAKKKAATEFQFRDIRKWNIRQAVVDGQDGQEFAAHADRRTTDRHYLNQRKRAKPLK